MMKLANTILVIFVVSATFFSSTAFAGDDDFYGALRLGYFPYTAEIEGVAGGRSFDTEADLSDIMDETETLLGGEIEIGKGKFFLNFAGFFQEIETSVGTTANGAKVVASETGLNPMLGYRAFQQGMTVLDVMAGVYYVKIDLDADINSTILGDIVVDRDVDFTDPMVGLRGYQGLTKKFGLGATAKFAVGGDSESHFDGTASLVYHINDMFAVSGGYRVWTWEYEDTGAPVVNKLEQTLSGPVLGLQIMFR